MQPPPAAAAAVPGSGRAFEFDVATSVTAVADGRFTGEIHAGWDIGGNANGGYVLALACRALREESGKPDPVTVTAHYLAPGPPGPVEIATQVVKMGKRFSTISGSVVKDGRPMLQLLGAFGDQTGGTAERLHQAGGPPELPPMDECAPRTRRTAWSPSR